MKMANTLETVRTAVKEFGPDGDPILKWIGFAVVFAFVIVVGVAISGTATAITNLIAQLPDIRF